MIGEYILLSVLLLAAIFIVVAVTFQRSEKEGLSGTISGGTETFFGKDKSIQQDKILSKWTMIVGIIFAICVLTIYIIQPDYVWTESVGSWKNLTDYANILK